MNCHDIELDRYDLTSHLYGVDCMIVPEPSALLQVAVAITVVLGLAALKRGRG